MKKEKGSEKGEKGSSPLLALYGGKESEGLRHAVKVGWGWTSSLCREIELISPTTSSLAGAGCIER